MPDAPRGAVGSTRFLPEVRPPPFASRIVFIRAQEMRHERVGSTGGITDRDVCMAAYTQGLPLQQIQVGRAMSTVVHTCGPEDSIESALALMRQSKVRRVPVTDGKRPVGILSISDVMRVLRSSHPRHPDEGLHATVIETLCILSEPGDAGQATEGRRGPRDGAAR